MSIVWSTWQAKVGAGTAIVAVINRIVVSLSARWKRWAEESSNRFVKYVVLVWGCILIWAVFQVWWEQGQDLGVVRGRLKTCLEDSVALGARLGAGGEAARESRQSAEKERYQRMIGRLSGFAVEADSVLAHFRHGPSVPYQEAEAWCARVAKYLRTCGMGYEAEFTGTWASDPEPWESGERMCGEDDVRARRELLIKFMNQLRVK